MRKSLINFLYFIIGIIWGISSILNFVDSKIKTGILDICIAVVFILLGFKYKKKQ